MKMFYSKFFNIILSIQAISNIICSDKKIESCIEEIDEQEFCTECLNGYILSSDQKTCLRKLK